MRTAAEQNSLLYRAGVFLIVLVLGLILYELALSSWNAPVELGTYDMLLRMRPIQPIRNDIVILAIDKKTIAELGPLPWSRAVHAQIVRALQRTDAKCIIYDMLFPQPDSEHPGADRVFWRAMTIRDDVFLPMVYDPLREADWNSEDLRALILLEEFVLDERITYTNRTPKYMYYYFIPPWADFISAARGVGIDLTPTGSSPVVRQTQLASLATVKYPVPSEPLPPTTPLPKLTNDTVVVPGLPLDVSRALMEVRADQTQVTFGDSVTFLADLQPYVQIPIDDAGRMMINYAGPAGSYPYVSAIDLIQGKADAGVFDDKIVFVGVTNPETTLPSILRTSFGFMPRAEANAHSVATILDRSYITRTRQDVLVAMLILAIIIGLLMPIIPRWDLAPMGLVSCLSYILIAVMILTLRHHALPMIPALILIMLGSSAAAFLKPALFARDKEVVEEEPHTPET